MSNGNNPPGGGVPYPAPGSPPAEGVPYPPSPAPAPAPPQYAPAPPQYGQPQYPPPPQYGQPPPAPPPQYGQQPPPYGQPPPPYGQPPQQFGQPPQPFGQPPQQYGQPPQQFGQPPQQFGQPFPGAVLGPTNVCPRCRNPNIYKPSWTWWGGWLGPMLVNNWVCRGCGFNFDPRTGRPTSGSVTTYIIVSVVLSLLFAGFYCVRRF